MTFKQKVLQKVYPAFIRFSKLVGHQDKVLENENNTVPPVSFYSLKVRLSNGSELPMELLRGKSVIIVNTASNCGYTPQYDRLQKLYESYKGRLEIIAFPSNDFKEQEKAGDEEIARFCKLNFGVSFPIAKKSSVLKGLGQDEVFNWLSDPALNGWNAQEPSWNFSKYIINAEGILTHYYDPAEFPEIEF